MKDNIKRIESLLEELDFEIDNWLISSEKSRELSNLLMDSTNKIYFVVDADTKITLYLFDEVVNKFNIFPFNDFFNGLTKEKQERLLYDLDLFNV